MSSEEKAKEINRVNEEVRKEFKQMHQDFEQLVTNSIASISAWEVEPKAKIAATVFFYREAVGAIVKANKMLDDYKKELQLEGFKMDINTPVMEVMINDGEKEIPFKD